MNKSQYIVPSGNVPNANGTGPVAKCDGARPAYNVYFLIAVPDRTTIGRPQIFIWGNIAPPQS
jgi:hypothetical protein